MNRDRNHPTKQAQGIQYTFDLKEPGYTIEQQILRKLTQFKKQPVLCKICKKVPVYYSGYNKLPPNPNNYVCEKCWNEI